MATTAVVVEVVERDGLFVVDTDFGQGSFTTRDEADKFAAHVNAAEARLAERQRAREAQ